MKVCKLLNQAEQKDGYPIKIEPRFLGVDSTQEELFEYIFGTSKEAAIAKNWWLCYYWSGHGMRPLKNGLGGHWSTNDGKSFTLILSSYQLTGKVNTSPGNLSCNRSYDLIISTISLLKLVVSFTFMMSIVFCQAVCLSVMMN